MLGIHVMYVNTLDKTPYKMLTHAISMIIISLVQYVLVSVFSP